MSLLDKARAGQGFLEQIANAIPGFKGYREKELRRDADKLEREHLAAQLEECKKTFNTLASDATRGGSLDVINDIETARKRLDKVVARIRYADRGYAGFFDAIKVDEAMLERVYQFDAGLLADVKQVQRAAAEAGALGDPKAGVTAILAAVDALDARLGEREQILSGIR
jgi:hypothetical protein